MTPYYVLFFSAMIFSSINPFTPFQWKNRIVLISGPDEQVQKQVAHYKSVLSEVQERDLLIIYEVKKSFQILPEGNYPPISYPEIKEYFDLSSDFSSLLIGKDGGVKSRDKQIILDNTYFVKIDGMPMRRREMQDKGGN